MLVQIPLTEDERAAAEGDQTAIDRLINQLSAVPTPSAARQDPTTTTGLSRNGGSTNGSLPC